jgi:4-hydroxy-tetrahydrodipicolinate synthase
MSALLRSNLTLHGYMPAIPTPFDATGKIDHAALAHFCDLQIREGATALVVCGTTGEAPTLTAREQEAVVRTAVGVSDGRVPVIAGAGSNSTIHAIELACDAEAAGADAVLSVVPYYNKPGQLGLYAHFRAIAEAIGLPVVLYDVPSRTACGLADETITRLAEIPQFIGLKDATGDIVRAVALRSLLGSQFTLLSGNDATALAFMAHGGDGCISVTSNLAPRLCGRMYLEMKDGCLLEAQRLNQSVLRLTDALFQETNPVPLKYALSQRGLMSPKVRLPLVEPAQETKRHIEAVLGEFCDRCSDAIIGKADTDERRAAAKLTA